jgi:hypothetical protein
MSRIPDFPQEDGKRNATADRQELGHKTYENNARKGGHQPIQAKKAEKHCIERLRENERKP